MNLSQDAQSPTESPLMPVPYRPVLNLAQLEEMSYQFEQNAVLIPFDENATIAREYGNMAGVAFALGDANTALVHSTTAIQAAEDSRDTALVGYLHNTMGAILCFMGQYEESCLAFDRAEAIFTQTGDLLGMAWKQHLFAREYLRDKGDYALAYSLLTAALPALRSRGTSQAMIENLLTQADCIMRQSEIRRAKDLLKQIEEMIIEHKSNWYKPEIHLLRARLAMIEGNFKFAWQQCYKGIGAVGNMGDLRMLPALYLSLAAALEYDRMRTDDARDALERAINMARLRARRLHLAFGLRQMGLHLRRYSNRPTVRARGSGFLYEADTMFHEMGLVEFYSPQKQT